MTAHITEQHINTTSIKLAIVFASLHCKLNCGHKVKATFKAFTLMNKKKPYFMEKLWTMAAAMFNLQATRSQHQLQELMRRVYKKSPTLHILKEQAKLRLFFH